jgi:hypothetical protein
MQEEVFLKIGGNRNVWAVYKYFTLCKSFLELDLITSVVFMVTSIFIWFGIEERDLPTRREHNLLLLIPEVVIFLVIIVNNWHGHHLVSCYHTIYIDR